MGNMKGGAHRVGNGVTQVNHGIIKGNTGIVAGQRQIFPGLKIHRISSGDRQPFGYPFNGVITENIGVGIGLHWLMLRKHGKKRPIPV